MLPRQRHWGLGGRYTGLPNTQLSILRRQQGNRCKRIDVDDERALSILDKMTKQRRDSIAQYQEAGRDELAAQEQFEIDVLNEFLPEALSEDELSQLVADAIAQSGATSMQNMGSVMGILKPQVQGRADMAQVSRLVKAQLG